MRIVFMGTAHFGLPCLERLLDSRHTVEAVVTGPDRPRGRGRKTVPSPVKCLAQSRDLPILQPERFKDETFLAALRGCTVDLFVVVAFRILPEEVFAIPPRGTINLHASLLPRYRGAAPIQWAVINGERRTGLTTFIIDAGIDTGGILLQQAVDIDDEETAGHLHDRMALLGADLLLETIERIEDGTAVTMPQRDGEATPAPKLKKEDGRIDWSGSAVDIRNRIRGMNPVPGAFSTLKDRLIKIWKATIVESGTDDSHPPGRIIRAHSRDGLIVSTGEGFLSLDEVQPEGKGKMSGPEFVRGYTVERGEFFEGSGGG